MTKSTQWEEWSKWTECKDEERTRFRACVQTEITDDTISGDIDFTDTANIDNLLPTLCEVKKIETERQLCFTAKKSKNGNQKFINPNPFMIEEEITAFYLKRPKINPESVEVVKIYRD
uniref:SHSP domain-containing protein n=1 Tax=Elaeophora elaphi TaxID=1147741 RepID=A0A0R3RZF0_9BILA